ncbi:MAG: glycosyltransferase family 2 protein, partial [Hyphomicrobiales bacterium]|nr:glycosyltransferase family 2 protein [Hyphomicrobiales bacterium]
MMPAYNAERYIEQAIDSVLAQSYPHWELIIVNDGSTDRTPDILTRYTDARIKVLHQANGG